MNFESIPNEHSYRLSSIAGEATIKTPPYPETKIFTTNEPIQSIIGPELNFTIIEYNFVDLTRLLLDFERSFGFSSLEMFQRFINNEFSGNSEIEDWYDLFILYLGTHEIRNISCP